MRVRRPPRRGRRVAGAVGLLVLAGSLGACGAARLGVAAVRCDQPIPEIFQRASPAVVYISATSINPYRLADRVSHVIGSGFLFDAAGLILTNAHVAFSRQSIRVTLDDGTSLPARLMGADPIFDLAVLRVEPPDGVTLPTVPLGDSDVLRVGEEVVAIGNPLGLDQTLTRGIVSAVNRILPDTPFSLTEPLIQTDTPINPGNSGGPLLDRCGEVVGINTAVIADAHSIGFAVPINLARAMLPALLRDGRVIRPWLGFHGQVVEASLRDLLRLPLVEGLLVEVIEPGSPAEQAGLQGGHLELVVAGREFLLGGDIVTSLNGHRLTSPEEMAEAMRTLKVGDRVSLTVFRQGDYRDVNYVLPERPFLPGDLPEQRSATPARGRRGPSPPPGQRGR